MFQIGSDPPVRHVWTSEEVSLFSSESYRETAAKAVLAYEQCYWFASESDRTCVPYPIVEK